MACLNRSYCSSAGLPFLHWPQCLSQFSVAFYQAHTGKTVNSARLPMLLFVCSSSWKDGRGLVLELPCLGSVIKSPAPAAPCELPVFQTLLLLFFEPDSISEWVNDGSQGIQEELCSLWITTPLHLECVTKVPLHSLYFEATVSHIWYNLSERNSNFLPCLDFMESWGSSSHSDPQSQYI